jgi:hypothetical protein
MRYRCVKTPAEQGAEGWAVVASRGEPSKASSILNSLSFQPAFDDRVYIVPRSFSIVVVGD